jgi:hypothetical protein
MRFWIALMVAGGALAQQPPGGDNMVNMQSIAQGLGVKCEYCHTGQRGQPSPKQDIARAMIAMTREINTKIVAATGKPPNEATRVTCITCHRGVAIPGQLSDIVTKTALRDGPEMAVAQYRELRGQYYGRRRTTGPDQARERDSAAARQSRVLSEIGAQLCADRLCVHTQSG